MGVEGKVVVVMHELLQEIELYNLPRGEDF